MYTDFTFIEQGRPFPFDDECYKHRHKILECGRDLYDGKLLKVFKDLVYDLMRKTEKSEEEIHSLLNDVNLFKMLTDTYKFLAFEDAPDICATNQDALNELVNDNNFIDVVMKRAFISCHAQSEGVFKVCVKDGKVKVKAINPELVITVTQPDDMDEVQGYVVYNDYEVITGYGFGGKPIKEKRLLIEINERGVITTRLHKVVNGKIASQVQEESVVNYASEFGYNGFLVFPFDFGRTAWQHHAEGQYKDIITLVRSLIKRMTGTDLVLDEHATPQLLVGMENLEQDPHTQKRIYRRGKALTISQDGVKPSYLTWDGSLDNSQKQIDRLMQMFYMVTGTSPQMYGVDIAGNLSGDALAKILLLPLAKTKEMMNSQGNAAEKALECALKLMGIDDKVCIEFEIGEFNTKEDDSKLAQDEFRTGIRSLYSAVEEINPEMTEEQVVAEVEAIKTGQVTALDVSNFNNL